MVVLATRSYLRTEVDNYVDDARRGMLLVLIPTALSV